MLLLGDRLTANIPTVGRIQRIIVTTFGITAFYLPNHTRNKVMETMQLKSDKPALAAQTNDKPEPKRGNKKQPRLEKHEKQSITTKAIAVKHADELSNIVTDNLYTPAHVKITPEQYQVILTRVTGGETVRAVCATLGLPHGAVYARAAYDREWAEEFLTAMEIGQHALVDSMAEIAMDPAIGVERARLIVDVIKWTAARRNRVQYGDKLAIDARVQAIPVILPIDLMDGDGV